MIHTKVYATDEEFEDLKRLVAMGWQQGEPMFVVTSLQGILKDKSTVDAMRACHNLALSKGLPEIRGYYGITNDKEFVSY